MDTANLRIISDLKKFLMEIHTHTDLWSRSVISDKAFTRKRNLPFSTLVLMILNLPKRSLSIELHSFFSHINRAGCGKSAFSMQRSKLKAFFFQLWNEVLIRGFYQYYGSRVKRWKGFIMLAFDDSTISLPNTTELGKIYGYTSNGAGRYGVAACGCVMYDALNKLILDSKLLPYQTSERSVVMEQLKHAPSDSLLTFDRGYPCFWLFYLLLQKTDCKFIMRASKNFNQVVKTFLQSPEQDQTATFHPSSKSIKQMKQFGLTITQETFVNLRIVKIPLKSGETEILITNLDDSQIYSLQDLKEAYFLRWKVETCFSTLKNQLQIEIFSGIRQLCVEQDFFANLFVHNLQSIIEKQCEDSVAKVNQKRMHNYQINKNISLGIPKNRIVDMFLEDNPQEVMLELQALFRLYLEPVRPNRTYPRIQKTIQESGKHKTFTNYKRAI